jgi:hypothetical protein
MDSKRLVKGTTQKKWKAIESKIIHAISPGIRTAVTVKPKKTNNSTFNLAN